MPKNHTLCEPGDARPTDGIEDHACPFNAGNLLHARRQIFLLRRLRRRPAPSRHFLHPLYKKGVWERLIPTRDDSIN